MSSISPTGRRQPRSADVGHEGVSSACERRQRLRGEDLDRKLIISRGC